MLQFAFTFYYGPFTTRSVMTGLFVFEAGLQGKKVNVEDLIEDG